MNGLFLPFLPFPFFLNSVWVAFITIYFCFSKSVSKYDGMGCDVIKLVTYFPTYIFEVCVFYMLCVFLNIYVD